MRTHNRRFRLTAVAAATGLAVAQTTPLPAAAQGPPPPPPGVQDQQSGGDPPARVGRLARVSGTVSFHGQDDTQWSPAEANYPVTSGNAFWTEPNAQAEIEVSASRIAMAPGTELDITTLDDTALQVTEPQGETYLHIRTTAPDETYALQTPRGLVTFAGTGRYDVVAGDTQTPTSVTVIEGAAQVTGPGVSLQVGPNQTATINGADSFQADVGPAQHDPFLSATLNSERPPPQAVAVPPVVAAMPGGDDLAEYGAWSESPEYGQVWYPQVAPDWVPYRDGSWAYVAPWGWTWVDSAPWGFAPFHYGRWAEIGGRWGWYPGGERREGRYPVYAPALVTFFGVGAAVGVGVGAALAAGRMGWLPLGPREAYHPWYHASDRYVRQVNIAHTTNVSVINRNVTVNNFANRGAATVVPTSAMTASRPVRPVAQRIDAGQLAQVRPVFGQQPLRPAATTRGVTPVVARQLNLAPTAGAVLPHATAPGPAIRPIGVVPGGGLGAANGRPPPSALRNPPALQNPTGPVPAAARPFGGPPALATPGARPGFQGAPDLRAPQPQGQSGPPPIQHFPGAAPPTAPHPVPAPGLAATPTPHPGGQPAPQVIAPATLQPQIHNGPIAPTPPAIHPVAPPAVPAPAFRAPPQVNGPPPAPAFHAPPPVSAPAFHAPPPQVNAPSPAPAFHAPPPQVNAPPPAPAFHAPPPQDRAPPPVHVSAPPAPQFHPPPPAAAPASHSPPPAAQQQQQRQKRPGEQ